MDTLIEIIATRNIITHNRGLIDEKYLRTVNCSDYKFGERRELEVEYFFYVLHVTVQYS